MIAKMKILAIVFSLVIGGSAATLAMGGDNGDRGECKDAPKTMYAVHLAEVEARYDHEIYLLISSENGEPVCGIVEILPPKIQEKEWEEKESREDLEQDERESEEEREWDREEEEERPEEDEEEREREEDSEEERGEEREEDEEEREGDREEGEEREERECRERQRGRKRSYRFNFEEGKGRFLLFPSSHRSLGATAIIIMRTQGEVKITPFIIVKNTDTVVFPDSEDENGHYCEVERIKGGAKYSFEDLMDSPDIECDWDYDDVVLFIGRLPKKDCYQKEDVEREEKENKKD